VNSINREEFQSYYQAGKNAFECGQYRLSIEKLEQATQLIGDYSRLGGETQMWLINAYLAAGNQEKAIALCQQLLTHPHPQIREQSKNLLYIIKAPKLKRPKEWMTEIPDFNSLSESQPQYRRSSNPKNIKPKRQIETVDLSKVNTKDNQFIWLGLLLILLTITGLLYLK
jgi:tetratricopeptide (TPR) repeat protein